MNSKSCLQGALLLLLTTLNSQLSTAFAQSSAFTYQGQLNVGASAANGIYDLRFTLYDSSGGSNVVAGPRTNAPTPVNNGLFTVLLDFGVSVFTGADRWLEIGVRSNGSAGAYQTLSPRQPLTASPYATRAQTVSLVADAALSSNVPLLNSSPRFTTPVSATMLRVAEASGGGLLKFGPTDLCTIGVDPQGPAGLLLRDPNGLRILSPNPAVFPPILRFGPTDDCSIGIDPAFPGLLLRDPSGLRILPASANALPILRFGPTDDCTIGVNPGLAGLLLRDPGGVRILSPSAQRFPTLRFGPTDDCSIGIDPAFPGLLERDAIGFRLLGQNNQGGRLIFGPTTNCTIEVQPPGTNSFTGLLLRDPNGVRLLNPSLQGTNTILFGPTEACRIMADPNSGLRFADPRGFTFGNQVTVNGPVFAQNFIPTSSRRFKNDVKPIEQPLEKIAQLQGVRFTWNEEKGGQKDVGFIAEDVAKVFPELVSWEADGQNARGVNYDHLVAVAIEGIKTQQSQIQTLEREKAELKQSLETMQAKLDRLSQKLEALAAR